MKHAICIVSGETGRLRLFAVAKESKYVTNLRNWAKEEIRKSEFNGDWITVYEWRIPEFEYYPQS